MFTMFTFPTHNENVNIWTVNKKRAPKRRPQLILRPTVYGSTASRFTSEQHVAQQRQRNHRQNRRNHDDPGGELGAVAVLDGKRRAHHSGRAACKDRAADEENGVVREVPDDEPH